MITPMVAIEAVVTNEYFHALIIFLVSVLFANICHYTLRNVLKKFASKTKSDLDDIILGIVIKPLYIIIIIGGIYVALKYLTFTKQYSLYINRIFFLIIVLSIATVLSKIISLLIGRWFKVQKRFEKTPQLLTKIIAVTIYLIALLMILKNFNIDITPLIATLGIGGLAIGLALQSTLSNFFSGLYIISDGPVNVGDFIELDPTMCGYVEDIGWRSTRIRTIANTTIIVPNSKLAESTITNNSLNGEDLTIPVSCGVGYESNLAKVEKITIDVAKKVQKTVAGAVKDFEPIVRFKEFGDSNINFITVLKADNFDAKSPMIHEFIKALKERYDKEGIEISYPVRKMVYNGDKPKKRK